jgi:hypothetical protein
MTREYYNKRQRLLKATAERHAELRRKVRGALRATGRPMSVGDLCQALPDESQSAIQQELYELSRNPRSDLFHNGLRGRGSLYSIGLVTIETVEE